MPVSAAISAGVGAVTSVFGANTQANAATTASEQQATSDANALALQKQMFGTARNALNPYIQSGESVMPQLQSLLAAGGSPTLNGLLNPGTAASTLSSLPGFQFQSQWGNLSATNALAAEGLGGSAARSRKRSRITIPVWHQAFIKTRSVTRRTNTIRKSGALKTLPASAAAPLALLQAALSIPGMR